MQLQTLGYHEKNDVGTFFVLVIIPTTLVRVLSGILLTIPTSSTILWNCFFFIPLSIIPYHACKMFCGISIMHSSYTTVLSMQGKS